MVWSILRESPNGVVAYVQELDILVIDFEP